MPGLGKLQKRHFRSRENFELKALISDWRRQQTYIAFSTTKAGEDKRAELQAMIDFCQKLLASR